MTRNASGGRLIISRNTAIVSGMVIAFQAIAKPTARRRASSELPRCDGRAGDEERQGENRSAAAGDRAVPPGMNLRHRLIVRE